MSFEKFMAKAHRHPENGEQRRSPEPAASAQGPEAMTKAQFEHHLIERMNALLGEAEARKALSTFADVVAWKLAVLGHHCGAGATGHIVRLFGGHLEHLAKVERGRREAEQARRASHLPS